MRKAFTLIELISVMIIVSILASIVAPTFGPFKTRAICTEAVVGLSAIREALREYHVINGKYPDCGLICISDAAPDLSSTGFDFKDLNGTYFDNGNYLMDIGGGVIRDNIQCIPWFQEMTGGYFPVIAHKHDDATRITRDPGPNMDCIMMFVDNGEIVERGIPDAGYTATN